MGSLIGFNFNDAHKGIWEIGEFNDRDLIEHKTHQTAGESDLKAVFVTEDKQLLVDKKKTI